MNIGIWPHNASFVRFEIHRARNCVYAEGRDDWACIVPHDLGMLRRMHLPYLLSPLLRSGHVYYDCRLPPPFNFLI